MRLNKQYQAEDFVSRGWALWEVANHSGCYRMRFSKGNRIAELYQTIHDKSLFGVDVRKARDVKRWGEQLHSRHRPARCGGIPLGPPLPTIDSFAEMVTNSKDHTNIYVGNAHCTSCGGIVKYTERGCHKGCFKDKAP